MALTDHNEPALRPAAQVPAVQAPAAQANAAVRDPLPFAALARLPELHAESSEAARLAHFLQSAVAAGALLMLLGLAALALAGGATLQQQFAWSALVLLGVAAMLRSYIRSTARAFDRAPLREAARDLRAVLFYTGFAWGAGAFLLLGSDPVPLVGLCFACIPGAVLAVTLKDRSASLGFLAPVTALTAAAVILQSWSEGMVALTILLILQGAIAGLLFLPRRRTPLPAGLSLR